MFATIKLPDTDEFLVAPSSDHVVRLALQAIGPATSAAVNGKSPPGGAPRPIGFSSDLLIAHPVLLLAGLWHYESVAGHPCADCASLLDWIAQSRDRVPSALADANQPPQPMRRRDWVDRCRASERVLDRYKPRRGKKVPRRKWPRELARLLAGAADLRRKQARRAVDRIASPNVLSELVEQAQSLRRHRIDSPPWHPWQSATVSVIAHALGRPPHPPAQSAHANGRTFDAELQAAKLESLRQLAYGASHELNNPLANIAMRAQSLLKDESCPERRKRLQTIEQQALRAHEMISDLMLFAHPPAPHFDRVDLAELIRGIVIEVEPALAGRQIEIALDPLGEFHQWSVDVTQFAECIRALIKNSVESIGRQGRIELGLRRDEETATLTVRDTGGGIDDRIAAHIFDPYFSGREAGRGLGFGLSKAWRIVGLHGGEIACADPTPGRTTFALTFPREQRRDEGP